MYCTGPSAFDKKRENSGIVRHVGLFKIPDSRQFFGNGKKEFPDY
jgi:hypothetical protein